MRFSSERPSGRPVTVLVVGGAPVAEQARFDVVAGQRCLQQRVVQEIDLTDRQVVGGAPPAVQLREGVVVERLQLGRTPGRGHCGHRSLIPKPGSVYSIELRIPAGRGDRPSIVHADVIRRLVFPAEDCIHTSYTGSA
jgi:hypothetical protein